jgi:RND family efflux transporter MFP subunit
MNSILKATTLSFILLAACSAPDKKSELEALKKQRDGLNEKIAMLETELKKEGGDTSATKASLVEISQLKANPFLTYIDVQGKVDADENISISSEIPGTVTRIYAKVGNEVNAGDVLAETDARAILQSISDLQTNLDLANQLFEKQKSLWDQKIGTEIQFLQAKTTKESLEKKMATLQEQYRMTKIISPISGTIDAVDVKVGQAIAPGVPAIRVINFSNLKVKAELAEIYAGRVKKGDKVKVYFADMNDSIESIINFAARSISNISRTFMVELILDNKKAYHPNMVAKLKINDYVSAQPMISVPVKLLQNSMDGEKFVYVANADKAEKRVVTIGKEYSGMMEILTGLKEGDQLILKGYDSINEGDKISYAK